MESPMIPDQRPENRKPLVKMRPPMRSAIACLKCRRSKIKCDNNGGSSPCDNCIKTGKECVFQLPEAVPAPLKRSEPPTGTKQDKDSASERKKLKKVDEVTRIENQKASLHAEEVLSAPFLTEDLWEQLLDIYKLYYATELPFLHLPTVKEKLGRKLKSPQSQSGASDFNLVLLGILTLTARCHADLVKYVAHVNTPQGGNFRYRPMQTQTDPCAASEYYADALTLALGPMRTAMRIASVERVQSLLMLGLFEWSQTLPRTGGLSAWMYVGSAIRMAQFLRLGFGDKAIYNGEHITRPRDRSRKGALAVSEVSLDKEIKRRTMFACMIMDRMLACGKDRVSIVRSEDLQIQLPCSEDKFDLAMETRTTFLKQPPELHTERHMMDDSVLSRFIRLVDIWGDISRFSHAGGRLAEKHPPWDARTTFFKLRVQLEHFDSDLPDTFTWSRSNYFKHENHQASTAYVLLHTLRCICLIMLHREYIPFLPILCDRPVGPLDNPTFPESKFVIPEGFWLESAEQVFKAAREIVDLVEICQRKDKLPQSTIVMFAVWSAAFVGLYAVHFPHMDTERHMLDHDYEVTKPNEKDPEVLRRGPTALTYHTLGRMSMTLKMASTYVNYTRQMNHYLEKAKRDINQQAGNGQFLPDKASHNIRQGGGGLELYQHLSKPLKDFGDLQPDENSHGRIEPVERSRASTSEPSSSVATENYATSVGEPRALTSRSTPSATFAAINHTSNPPEGDNSGFELRPGSSVSQHSDPSSRYQATPHSHPSPMQQFVPPPVPVGDHSGQFPWNDYDAYKLVYDEDQPNRISAADLETLAYGEPQDDNDNTTWSMPLSTPWAVGPAPHGLPADLPAYPAPSGFWANDGVQPRKIARYWPSEAEATQT